MGSEMQAMLNRVLAQQMARGRRQAEAEGHDWWTAKARGAGWQIAEIHFRDGRRYRYAGPEGPLPPWREWGVL